MLEIVVTGQFKKDYKKVKKQNKDIEKLNYVIKLIAEEKPLLKSLKDHALIGNYKGRRECHIAADWLLIYKIENNTVIFERTGSHAQLLKL